MTFDPHQYTIDAGWDSSHIAATAAKGVAGYDRDRMTGADAATLRRWCRDQVMVSDRAILDAIAAVVTPEGLDVDDLHEEVASLVADRDDDDPGIVCYLADGRPVRWWNNGRVSLGGLIRRTPWAAR